MEKTLFQKRVLFFISIVLITWMSVLPGAYGSIITSTPPTIDGIAGASEWTSVNSTRFTVPNGFIHLMNDSNYLYVLIDITSDTGNDALCSSPPPWGDYFGLAFDVNQNSQIDRDVDVIFGIAGCTLNPCFSYFYSPGNTTPCTSPSPSDYLAVRGFGTSLNSGTSHRIWELQIPRSLILATATNSSLRFAVYFGSDTPPFTTYTPPNFMYDFSTAFLTDLTDQMAVTVTKSGTGSGTVTSLPTGINCGSDCTEDYAHNTSVTLTAVPDAGSYFEGWSGACSGIGDCILTMDASKSVTASFNSGKLYDAFSGPLINKSKWRDGEFVRMIDSGKLLLKQASSNPMQFTGYPSDEWNNLNFINPNSINSIQADVAIADFSINNTAHLRARVAGRWFNDGTSTDGMVGDIYGEVSLRADPTGLSARWAVSRSTNRDGTTWTTLKWGLFTTPIELGTTYILYISYNAGANQFTFKIGGETVTFGPDGLPAPLGGLPHSPWKAPGTRAEIADSTSSGYISATFANVYKNGVLYDDFSLPNIDATKWTSYEFVREVSEGQLRSKVRSTSPNTSILHNEFRLVNPWLPAGTGAQAKVTLLDYQNPDGLWERAAISAAFYNDGSAGGGRSGDVLALVYIGGSGAAPVGGWLVTRCGDYDCNPGQQTTLASGILSPTIGTGESHNLYLAWDGLYFTFGFDGMGVSLPNPSTILGPPKVPFGEGSTRIQPATDKTEGTIEAQFDDVMLSANPISVRRLRYFDLGIFNGGLAGSVIVLPGFRNLVKAATLEGPSGSGFSYPYNLEIDTLNWLSECRHVVGWQKAFGPPSPSAYGVYTLTIEYFDGLTETYTKNLQAAAVTPATNLSVTFDTGGYANLTWTAGSTQAYHVIVRSGDNTTEYYRSDVFEPFNSGPQTFQIPAGSLNCLEKGQSYNWVVRVYDLPPSYSGGVNSYNAAQPSSVSAPYNTALSDQRTSIFRADVREVLDTVPQSDFEVFFDVRAGSRDRIKQATVAGPNSYEFSLTDDWFNVSTETRTNKGWLHRDPTTWGTGNYTLTVTYDDDGNGTIDHTDTVTKYYQTVSIAGVDSATMTSTIDPNGAITFQWASAGSNRLYVVRIRSLDGTKEYHSASLTQTTVIFPSLIGLEHCKTYQWFVRAYDKSNFGTANAVVQSAPQPFFYNPFGLACNQIGVTKSGTGAGTVTSSPSGINCGSDCDETFVIHVPVILTATPNAGSTFTGWSGCTIVSGNQCNLTMDAPKNVTATFDVLPANTPLTVTKSGPGTVTSSPAGINCGATCSAQYIGATAVTLTATPDPSFSFTSWSGCDSTNGTQCTVTMNAIRNVTATFGPCTYSISPTSAFFDSSGGTGTISVATSGTACSWTATAPDVLWISVTGAGDTRTGDEIVYYSVVNNIGSNSRTGTITLGNQTFTVNQTASSTLSSPTGLQIIVQPGVKTLLRWNPVSGAAGYKVYYGTSSGVYQPLQDVGNATSYEIPVLPVGFTYFFAVTAYTSGPPVQEGIFSAEAVLLSYDADGDGVPDYMAVSLAPKNPPSSATCSDSDGDGLCDTQDNCPSAVNYGTKGTCIQGKTACNSSTLCPDGDTCSMNQEDADKDGVGDACDNCPGVANANQQKPVWYKDFDNDMYSDGKTVESCNRPKVCLSNTSQICTPILAGSTCTESCSGEWSATLPNAGNAYKSLQELALLPNGQKATSGDCNDDNALVNPGATENPGNGIDDDCNPATPDALYEIVFVNMYENQNLVDYFTWLPTAGVEITATAMVRKVSDGTIINPTSITLTYTLDTPTTPSPDITHLSGRYSNDPDAATDNTGPNGGPAPDYSVTGNNGGQVTLTSQDFGGTITFTASNITFTDPQSGTKTLPNQLVRLPRDADGDGLADAWEMAQFGTLNYGPSDDPDKDGLKNFDEYRGFMWGQLVANENLGNGYCSITTTRMCNAYARCPAGEKCLPYSYQTLAYVPELDPVSSTVRISHFRANPTRRDLFVKYSGYDGNYPFAIGTAYFEQGIDVHAVDLAAATTFFGGAGKGERKIDALSITNDLINTFAGEDPNLYRRSTRDWTFKTLGLSGFGNDSTYGSALTFRRVLGAYYSNRPYVDGTTLPPGSTVSNAPSQWSPKNGRLDPINKVENTSDDGRKGGGQDKNNNSILDGDYPVSQCSTTGSCLPWFYNKDISPFNINNKYVQVCTGTTTLCTPSTVCSSGTCDNDVNRPLLELPVQSDPDNVPEAVKFTREQVLKHVSTHEIGHAVGVYVENADSTCVMYQYSNNWIRDKHFSRGAAALIRIHNCCSTD